MRIFNQTTSYYKIGTDYVLTIHSLKYWPLTKTHSIHNNNCFNMKQSNINILHKMKSINLIRCFYVMILMLFNQQNKKIKTKILRPSIFPLFSYVLFSLYLLNLNKQTTRRTTRVFIYLFVYFISFRRCYNVLTYADTIIKLDIKFQFVSVQNIATHILLKSSSLQKNASL